MDGAALMRILHLEPLGLLAVSAFILGVLWIAGWL